MLFCSAVGTLLVGFERIIQICLLGNISLLIFHPLLDIRIRSRDKMRFYVGRTPFERSLNIAMDCFVDFFRRMRVKVVF